MSIDTRSRRLCLKRGCGHRDIRERRGWEPTSYRDSVTLAHKCRTRCRRLKVTTNELSSGVLHRFLVPTVRAPVDGLSERWTVMVDLESKNFFTVSGRGQPYPERTRKGRPYTSQLNKTFRSFHRRKSSVSSYLTGVNHGQVGRVL